MAPVGALAEALANRNESTPPRYRPQIFDVGGVDEARRFILTSERGHTSARRWERETPYLVELTAQALAPREGAVLLDYGCGIGRIARGLVSRLDCTIVGVDISASMRRLAMEFVDSDRFAAVTPRTLDAMVEAGLRFHGAYAIWVIQHCLRPETDIARIESALAPGAGLFVVNSQRRAVPTDRGWIDDGKGDEALIDEKLEPAEIMHMSAAAIGREIRDLTFAKLWRKRD